MADKKKRISSKWVSRSGNTDNIIGHVPAKEKKAIKRKKDAQGIFKKKKK